LVTSGNHGDNLSTEHGLLIFSGRAIIKLALWLAVIKILYLLANSFSLEAWAHTSRTCVLGASGPSFFLFISP